MRGVVIGPRIMTNAGPFQFDGSIDSALLRRTLLYWDRIAIPELRGPAGSIGMGGQRDGDLKRLLDQSIVESVPVAPDLTPLYGLPDDHTGVRMLGIPGGWTPHIFTMAQIAIAKAKTAKGELWTIAQSGTDLNLPPLPGTSADLVEYHLASCLPVPDSSVPVDDILEFREKHAVDLLRFRKAIEGLRTKVVTADDPQRTLITASEEIALTAKEVEGHMNKRGYKNAMETLKAVMNARDSALLTATLTAAGGSTLGIPIPLGAAIGLGANALITLVHQMVVGGQQLPDRLKDFTYVFECDQKFRS